MSNKKDAEPGTIVPLDPNQVPEDLQIPDIDQFAPSDFDIKVEALRCGVDLVAGYHGRREDHKSSPDTDAVDYAKTFEAYLREPSEEKSDEG